MSIKGQGHSLTLVKGHSDFKVKCLTFGLYTQVSDSGPHGPLVYENDTNEVQGSYHDDCLEKRNKIKKNTYFAYSTGAWRLAAPEI